MKKLLFLLMILFSATVTVSAKVPYILENGSLIDATQLNEIFSYLDRYNHAIRANGVQIGYTSHQLSDVSSDISSTSLLLVKINDYVINIGNDGRMGKETPIHFKNADCIGDPYFKSFMYDSRSFFFPPGIMKVFDNDSLLYYYPAKAQLYKMTINSYKLNGTCFNGADSGNVYIKLLLNDPVITGIQTYPFPLPITIDGVVESVIVE